MPVLGKAKPPRLITPHMTTSCPAPLGCVLLLNPIPQPPLGHCIRKAPLMQTPRGH